MNDAVAEDVPEARKQRELDVFSYRETLDFLKLPLRSLEVPWEKWDAEVLQETLAAMIELAFYRLT